MRGAVLLLVVHLAVVLPGEAFLLSPASRRPRATRAGAGEGAGGEDSLRELQLQTDLARLAEKLEGLAPEVVADGETVVRIPDELMQGLEEASRQLGESPVLADVKAEGPGARQDGELGGAQEQPQEQPEEQPQREGQEQEEEAIAWQERIASAVYHFKGCILAHRARDTVAAAEPSMERLLAEVLQVAQEGVPIDDALGAISAATATARARAVPFGAPSNRVAFYHLGRPITCSREDLDVLPDLVRIAYWTLVAWQTGADEEIVPRAAHAAYDRSAWACAELRLAAPDEETNALLLFARDAASDGMDPAAAAVEFELLSAPGAAAAAAGADAASQHAAQAGRWRDLFRSMAACAACATLRGMDG